MMLDAQQCPRFCKLKREGALQATQRKRMQQKMMARHVSALSGLQNHQRNKPLNQQSGELMYTQLPSAKHYLSFVS